MIPKWVSNHVDNGNSTSLINALVPDNNIGEFKSLKYQANKFFIATLGVKSRHMNEMIKPMLEHGMSKSAIEELEDLLEPLDSDYSNKIKRLFSRALIERIQNNKSDSMICSQCNCTIESEKEPAAKKRKIVNSSNDKGCDFSKRHGLAKLNGSAKIITMLDAQAEHESMNLTDLADKAQSFVRQSLKPFMKCFKDCCQSRPDIMLRDYNNTLRLSKFSCAHQT